MWLKELNDFFSSTTIHGFHYISRSQSHCTRFVWTVLVLVALAAASVFLYQSFADWETNYVSTTLETRAVHHYPFPAVTFYPGEFSSQKAFLRTLLNQFSLTRYEESSPLYGNEVFLEKFYNLVTSPGPSSTSLFDWVPDYLLYTEKTFIEKKGATFRKEVCSLLALKNKAEPRYGKVKEEIIGDFNKNMFKYSGFSDVLAFSKKSLNSLVTDVLAEENITNTDTIDACNNKENSGEKKKIEALVLSFLYIFVDQSNVKRVGAGDIAAEEHFLIRESLHTEITNLVNDLWNVSLPPSVFVFPEWLLMPRQSIIDLTNSAEHLGTGSIRKDSFKYH